jgi:hypothetical protein
MEFKLINPDAKYSKITYNGTHTLVNVEDVSGETIEQIMQLCDNHHLNANAGFPCRRLYYLRGARNQCPYEQVLVGFLETDILPPEYLRSCIAFPFGIRKRKRCLPLTVMMAKPCNNLCYGVLPLIAGRLYNRVPSFF